jgi:uncharacterized membrane protein YhaH (DUF805 family)
MFTRSDAETIRQGFQAARKLRLDLTGRATPVDYLPVAGALILLQTAAYMWLSEAGPMAAVLKVCIVVHTTIHCFALTSRRLRDAGLPQVWLPILFVPGLSLLMVPILAAMPSVRR